jgi:hypothetical protein
MGKYAELVPVEESSWHDFGRGEALLSGATAGERIINPRLIPIDNLSQ